MIATVVFWICLLALMHSYLLYPILLSLLTPQHKLHFPVFGREDELPTIYILMAVHNEEVVIEEKVGSIYDTTYPIEKIKVFVGSDASTDNTNAMLEGYLNKYPEFFPIYFPERSGKIAIINTLYGVIEEEAKDSLLLMTDANVFFEKNTLYNIARHFKDEKVGLVGGNVLNSGVRKDGISFQEKSYIHRENMIKYREGLLWGTMMGAFGACYALRANLFKPVPADFKVDDFYLTLSVLEHGKQAICDLEAVSYEDVSNEMSEEFRRKVRIATGNFQNLWRFKGLLFPPFKAVAFTFFSHKVLRWLGPFFIAAMYISNLFLLEGNIFYQAVFTVQLLLLLVPLIDWSLKKIGLHIVILRFIAYFYFMNLALMVGFFKYLVGGQQNVWQPTKRNQ